MRLFQRLFYQPEYTKNTVGERSICRLLAPSVISIFICAVCLCSASWAWFTASTSTGAEKIQSASFQISDVKIIKGSETTEVSIGEEDGKYTLDQGTYTLSFKAAEDNTSSKGYCCITVYKEDETAGTKYYTENLGTGTYTVTVVNNENKIAVKIEPFWGDVAKVTDGTIASEDRITVGPADNSDSNELNNSDALLGQEPSETTEQTTIPAQEAENTASEDNAATTPETPVVETEKQKETTKTAETEAADTAEQTASSDDTSGATPENAATEQAEPAAAVAEKTENAE